MILRIFLAAAALFSLGLCEHDHSGHDHSHHHADDMGKGKVATMFQSVAPNEATLIRSNEEGKYCAVCGMNLVKFYKTNHVWEGKQLASLHCLYEITKGQIPKNAQVVDTKNLNFIDVNKAFYVVGSKVKGTMTRNSKYAFSTEADAKEFMAQNGGEIMNFAQAYKIAGLDFMNDQKMIKAKREGGTYAKGKEFYEKYCEKKDPKKFKNIAELKASLKTTCGKEQGFEGDYDGQLQAAALYLWDNPKNLTSNEKSSSKPKLDKIIVPKGAKCPICGMFVDKNPNWAAMIEVEGGENLYFDGVKDLMKYYFQNDKKFDKIYVSDYYKLNKIDAKSAFFVLGSNVFGPMGDELIPFANEEEAKTFAKDHGGKSVVKFNDIDEKTLEGL